MHNNQPLEFFQQHSARPYALARDVSLASAAERSWAYPTPQPLPALWERFRS